MAGRFPNLGERADEVVMIVEDTWSESGHD